MLSSYGTSALNSRSSTEIRHALALEQSIGATPLVELARFSRGTARIFAKLEWFNPGGSVKDRIALAMIADAEQRGLLAPGGTIVEPTSGNTGVGLAMLAAVKGYRCVIVMPEGYGQVKARLMEAFGASVIRTPSAELMTGAIERDEGPAWETHGARTGRQVVCRQTVTTPCEEDGSIDDFTEHYKAAHLKI